MTKRKILLLLLSRKQPAATATAQQPGSPHQHCSPRSEGLSIRMRVFTNCLIVFIREQRLSNESNRAALLTCIFSSFNLKWLQHHEVDPYSRCGTCTALADGPFDFLGWKISIPSKTIATPEQQRIMPSIETRKKKGGGRVIS